MIKILNTRDEYFAEEALNYSFLKAFDITPESALNPEKLSGAGLTFGTAVDVLLFDGLEEFEKRFQVLRYNTPTDMLGTLATTFLQNIGIQQIDFNRSIYSEMCEELSDKLGLWGNIKDPVKRKAKFDTDEFWGYIKESLELGDKIPLDREVKDSVFECVLTLKTNRFTQNYFTPKDNSIEIIYQLAIVYPFHGNLLKAMLDQVVIDHVNKTIQPCDTKTTADYVSNFPSNIVKYRYDLQAENYNAAIKAWRDELYPSYEILPFKFIVVSSQQTSKCLVFSIDPIDWRNRYNNFRFNKLRGLTEIIDNFTWHRDNQVFEYPREMYEYGYIEL